MSAPSKPKFFYGYWVIISAFTVMAVICGGLYSFGVFLKPVAEEFNWTRAVTSGAQSLNTFMSGALGLITGRLTDRFGPRMVVTFCGIFTGAGLLLMSQAGAVWQLYLFWGILFGAGMAGGFVPLTATAARWFTKRRGAMTGIVVAGVGAGTMVGPVVTSHFIESYGWPASFALIGIISLVLVLLGAQFLIYDPKKKGQLPYGGEADLEAGVYVSPGLSLREVAHTRQFWMLSGMHLLFGVDQMVIMTHIVPHATDQGIPPVVAANIMTVLGGVSVAGRVILGSLADRIGNKQALIAGLVMTSVSLFFLQIARDMWSLYLFAVLFGFGYGCGVAMISMMVAELFGMRALGSVLGVVNFSYHLGCTFGPFLGGRIFDITGSYYSAFLLTAVLSVISLLLVLPVRPIRREAAAV